MPMVRESAARGTQRTVNPERRVSRVRTENFGGDTVCERHVPPGGGKE